MLNSTKNTRELRGWHLDLSLDLTPKPSPGPQLASERVKAVSCPALWKLCPRGGPSARPFLGQSVSLPFSAWDISAWDGEEAGGCSVPLAAPAAPHALLISPFPDPPDRPWAGGGEASSTAEQDRADHPNPGPWVLGETVPPSLGSWLPPFPPLSEVWPPRAGLRERPKRAGLTRPPSRRLGHVAHSGLRIWTKGSWDAARALAPPTRAPCWAHSQWPMAAGQGVLPRCAGVNSWPRNQQMGSPANYISVARGDLYSWLITQTKTSWLFVDDL